VIEEWKVDDEMTVSEIVPDSKVVSNDRSTNAYRNKNAIFRIDPRLNGNKQSYYVTKQYVQE
jgi:hypothetical protein